MKTDQLEGIALDFMVAKAGGGKGDLRNFIAGYGDYGMYHYSSDDAQGGPIIDREHISTTWVVSSYPTIAGCWTAHIPGGNGRLFHAPSRLVAAMRCFCSAKLGAEVAVPEELCPQQQI